MNYKDFQKICKQNPDCYCPEEQVLKQYLANTPEYIRRYFIGVGKEKMEKQISNLKKELKEKESQRFNAVRRIVELGVKHHPKIFNKMERIIVNKEHEIKILKIQNKKLTRKYLNLEDMEKKVGETSINRLRKIEELEKKVKEWEDNLKILGGRSKVK